MFSALIIDDEKTARVRLARLLHDCKEALVIGEASNAIQALEEIARLKPQVIFLDIEMPELDGIEVAQSLDFDGPHIVFVTDHDENALHAFETHAVDYLVKPVSETRLRTCLQKISHRLQNDGSASDIAALVKSLKSRRKDKAGSSLGG